MAREKKKKKKGLNGVTKVNNRWSSFSSMPPLSIHMVCDLIQPEFAVYL
jgi:hypothetical protein